MYSWLWRKLPGSRWLKSVQVLLIVAAVLAAMYFWLFPWLDVTVFKETETIG